MSTSQPVRTGTGAVLLRLAVARTTLREDPGDPAGFRAAGDEVRMLLGRAKEQGARLVQFQEGTLCFPAKRRLSTDPDRMAEADWSRFNWDALAAELRSIVATAARLRIWTVLGVPRARVGARPYTGLLVIDDTGATAGYYRERILSRTKADFLYQAGKDGLVIEVDGVRIGLASGVEGLFSRVSEQYAEQAADLVLVSTGGRGEAKQGRSLLEHTIAQARGNLLWLGAASGGDQDPAGGVVSPGGDWLARLPTGDGPSLAVADVTDSLDPTAKAWHREGARRLAYTGS
ncbi:carbon-nitrogen hydrolase family protein [Microlunatus speluncae]|uniref:carbon-nitrogen hydrolase family protein n=1 Tax=Microlunatus speluncae TaxID=2594267 RepID=UPI001375BB63|nr:carbon-nitrogen hydrolase family protein [Microlunatus speluncae]